LPFLSILLFAARPTFSFSAHPPSQKPPQTAF